MEAGVFLLLAAGAWMWRYYRREKAELDQITAEMRAQHAEVNAEFERLRALNVELEGRARVALGEKLAPEPGPDLAPAPREPLHTEGAYR